MAQKKKSCCHKSDQPVAKTVLPGAHAQTSKVLGSDAVVVVLPLSTQKLPHLKISASARVVIALEIKQ